MVTVLAELLKCKSEIYELKENQLRLDQQSFNSSKSAGNLSETGPNSGVHGSNITTSVDSNSSSTKPQDCQKVTLEANKDADKDKVDETLLCVSDSLLHHLKPNEVFIKNNKTVKLAKSGDTAADVIERACDYVRNAQATSFTGIVLMAGTNDLGSRKKSNGNDKKPEEVARELVNGAKKLLSFTSVKNVFICKVSPRLDNAETDEKIQQLNHCLVNLLSDVEGVNIIDAVRRQLRPFNKDGIHLSRRGLSLQAKTMVKKLCSVINQSDVKTGKTAPNSSNGN